MRRRLVKLVLIGCAAVTVLLAAMWARSGYCGDFWSWGDGQQEWSLRSDWGRLVVMRATAPGLSKGLGWETNGGGYHGVGYGPINKRWEVPDTLQMALGTCWLGPNPIVGSSYVRVTLFYWVPVAITLLPLLLWSVSQLYIARRLAHRRELGLCLSCGYDVRGSTVRCPECGQRLTDAGDLHRVQPV